VSSSIYHNKINYYTQSPLNMYGESWAHCDGGWDRSRLVFPTTVP